MDSGIKALKEAGGSYRSIGARLGVSGQAVNHWRRIPQDRIVQIEKEFRIPREVLRPDLYKMKK